MNFDRFKNFLMTFLLSAFSLSVFFINIDIMKVESITNNIFYQFFYGLFLSIRSIDLKFIIIFIFIYSFLDKIHFEKYKTNNFYKILSVFLSVVTVLGICYSSGGGTLKNLFSSFLQIYKILTVFLGYYIIYYAVIIRVVNIDVSKISMKKTKFEIFFQKHPILITSLIFIIIYIPLVIIFYPGGSTGDTADSVYQFFHSSESWSIHSINLIDQDVYINKHHSVLFTVILGIFLQFGNYIYSYNLGFFLFVLFQLFIVFIVFTFMIYYMKKLRMPFYLILFSIVFICFSPLIIKYSLTAVKDTLSASFTLLYVIFLFQIVRNYNSIFKNKSRLLCFIIVVLLVMMLRNNGIYTILMSFPFLFILYKKYWKKLLRVFLFVLVIFGIYDNVLLPSLGVSDGSIREMLSIPFMQMARVAKYHEKDFSEEEINIINEVLDFNNIINEYNPNISDNVKNTYKYTATKQEFLDFFEIWFKYLKKYPVVYIDSFFNSTYGYFFPSFVGEDPKVLLNNFLASDIDLNIKHLNIFNTLSTVINYWLCYIYNSPFYIYFNNVAILDFILIFSLIYICRKKKYKYLIPLFPLLSILLVCLASPVNGCARYILPIIFSVPIVLSIDYFVYYECKNINL